MVGPRVLVSSPLSRLNWYDCSAVVRPATMTLIFDKSLAGNASSLITINCFTSYNEILLWKQRFRQSRHSWPFIVHYYHTGSLIHVCRKWRMDIVLAHWPFGWLLARIFRWIRTSNTNAVDWTMRADWSAGECACRVTSDRWIDRLIQLWAFWYKTRWKVYHNKLIFTASMRLGDVLMRTEIETTRGNSELWSVIKNLFFTERWIREVLKHSIFMTVLW